METTKVEWRVNTPGLLKEILVNDQVAILGKPLQIFSNILFQVGERCAELNDPILNGLMVRLAIYEIADPYCKAYDQKLVNETIEKYEKAKAIKKAAKRDHDYT